MQLVNNYPGVACDVPAHGYSYSFELNPNWSTAFAPGREIEEYIRGVARKYDVYQHCTFNAEVLSMEYDVKHCQWNVSWSVNGAPPTFASFPIVVSCVGGLHCTRIPLGSCGPRLTREFFLNQPCTDPAFPDAPGCNNGTFKGYEVHSAEWRAEVDNDAIRGKDVIVVGSAASAVQIVPEIEGRVKTLTVLQRTPNWLSPQRGWNMPANLDYGPTAQWVLNNVPFALRAYHANVYYSMEFYHLAQIFKKDSLGNKAAKAVLTRYMKHQLKGNKELEGKVIPKYTTGCKRIIRSERFLPTLLKPHVRLVTAGLERVEADGVVCANGETIKADCIIYATGYRVGYMGPKLKVVVPGSVQLSGDGAKARKLYGVCGPELPNFFTTLGTNSGLGHNSIIVVIEAQVDFIVGVLKQMRSRRVCEVRVKRDVLDAYTAEVDAAMEATVWTGASCKSWYQNPDDGKVLTLSPFSTLKFRSDAAPPRDLALFDCVSRHQRL